MLRYLPGVISSLLFASIAAATDKDLSVSSIKISDDNSDTSESASYGVIDVQQDTCDENETPEPFYQSAVEITVQNNTDAPITVQHLSYSVPRPYGTSRKVLRSKKLAVGDISIAAQSESSILSLLFDQRSGAKYYLKNNSAMIPSGLGLRNIELTVHGANSSGKKITAKSRVAVIFGNYNRCEN